LNSKRNPIELQKELEQLRKENKALRKENKSLREQLNDTYTPFAFDKCDIGMMLYDNDKPNKQEQEIIDIVYEELKYKDFSHIQFWDEVKEVVEDIRDEYEEEMARQYKK